MAEVLTEKAAEIADITAVPMGSTTETNVHEEAHLADGTLLEEMKKAVKQSTCFFLSLKSMSALIQNFFLVSCQKKLNSTSPMPTFLTTSAPTFWFSLCFLC